MTESIKHVMSQILGVDPGEIDDESSPATIERWDSLKHMQLIMALEDELEIQFPDEVIPELVTFKLIQSTVSKLTTG